ncbi:MAG: phosphotransferase family protein [Rhodospirillaceae bacterium]|nr:phosphotransferase family protein [Rhodospirillaceae bacterium]|tara:strand:+ start:189 stop:1241 length:1053 start_codon:yes stop_codon:yes gene_type:complete
MTAADTPTAETVPVRDAHRFDQTKLQAWLTGQLEGLGSTLEVLQMRGGQSNPTFLLHSGDREWVLRKQPPGELLPSAHAVDREFRIQKALADTGVPVAKMYLFCDDRDVIGTPFYVMERMRGRVFENLTLPDLSKEERWAAFDSMNETLAKLHLVDWKALGLEDFGKPGSYFSRQIGRWSRQWEASKQREIPSMDALMEWLPKNIPDGDESTLVHGDFRLGNLMYAPDKPKVVAVFDWELSTLGHPLADLGYNCMPFHTTPEEFGGLKGLDLAALGLPDEKAYIAAYCERTGRTPFDPTFYIVFSMFRMAAILEGVYARGVSGIASNSTATTVGAMSKPFAERAWALAQG